MSDHHTGAGPLWSRLRAVASVLLPPGDVSTTAGPGALLERLVEHVQDSRRTDELWLLYAGISTVLPTQDLLREAARAIELRPAGEAARWLMRRGLTDAVDAGHPGRMIHVVTDTVVVDVDFSARHSIHTGIQRVVRSTLPIWDKDREITLTAWTLEQSALRTLAPEERGRVLDWDSHEPTGDGLPGEPDEDAWNLVIPWRCVVVVPEVPAKATCERLAALASDSGNHVVAIGYDCIPIASADLVPPAEPNRFVRYLSAVKYMRRIAGISASATCEFQGFAAMLETQGLPGPSVFECALPSAGPAEREPVAASGLPTILCVGSYEPRKNQQGLLFAAETLWREGLSFRLVFVGGGFPDRRFRAQIRCLTRAGRQIELRTAITEAELERMYTEARFTVFASLHEGYGLPVVESLSHGTPVITGDYGSTSEIAKAGGTVVLDPRDDDALADAMRDLLRDDDLLARLRDQIAHRPARTWAQYADDLWRGLVEPELATIA